MNSVLRIQVRVINGASPEIKAIQAELAKMTAAMNRASNAMATQAGRAGKAMNAEADAAQRLAMEAGRASKAVTTQGNATTVMAAKTERATGSVTRFSGALAMNNLEKFGKNLQWTGRQIEYNFTLPLVLAAGFATKWALENEAAVTRVRKVYGDNFAAQQFFMKQGMSSTQAATKANQVFNDEVAALDKTFMALSNTFGVNRSEVANVAADWAAAGASGLQLAKVTKLTMETMILGELDSKTATKSLIAISAQYGAGLKDLTDIIGTLNAVENSTGTTMGDLIEGFTRSAGAARTAGVDYRHLAAMIAALTPATGSATSAGNALRTMLSRIIAPTGDAQDLLRMLHINIDGATWAAKTGAERLIVLAKATDQLNQGQKAVISTYVASRYQVNRFDVLMRALIDSHGYYQRALDVTNTKTKIASLYQYELQKVMSSDPRMFARVGQTIKNTMVQIITPFIPSILAILGLIQRWAQAFANLSPQMQNIIVGTLVFIAVFGTANRLIGAAILLVSRLAQVFLWAGKALVFFLSPWGIVLAAAVLLVYVFRDDIIKALGGVVDNFYKLPGALATAFRAVISVIARAMTVIIEWLSYLNPFAHHSPSLVENVAAGVAAIARQYASLGNIGVVYRQAAADLMAFNRATQQARNAAVATQQAQDRKSIVRVSGDAGGAAYDRLVAAMGRVQAAMARVSVEYAKQSALVDRLSHQLDALNARLDAETAKLSRLQDVAQQAADALQAHKDALAAYLDAPLKGEKAMNEQILKNQIAQAHLRLEMMRLEKTIGPIDQVQAKLAGINGQIELLRGTQTSLRNAGAGSDILGQYDKQIKHLQNSKTGIEAQIAAYTLLAKKMDQLTAAADRLDAMKFLHFDAVHQQIALMADATKELTRPQIIAGIKREQDAIGRLTKQYNSAQAAVDAQQKVVNSLTNRRDALSKTYDAERAKLDAIGGAYDALNNRLQDMQAAIDGITSAAQAMNRTLGASKVPKSAAIPSAAQSAFTAAGKGDFKDAGLGSGIGGRKNWKSQADAIDKYTQRLIDGAMGSFGNLDMFSGIKADWKQAWDWINTTIGPYVDRIKANIGQSLVGGGIGALIGSLLLGPIGAIAGGATGALVASYIPPDTGARLRKMYDSNVMPAWDYISGQVSTAIGKVRDIAGALWRLFGADLTAIFVDTLQSLGQAFKTIEPDLRQLWGALKVFGAAWLAMAKIVGPVVFLALIAGLKIVVSVLRVALPFAIATVATALGGFIDIIAGVIRIIGGLVGMVSEVIRALVSFGTGHPVDALNHLGKAFEFLGQIFYGVGDIIMGTMKMMVGYIVGTVQVIIAVVIGFVRGIVKFFQWLYDELVGHSIVPDLVHGIVALFKWMIAPVVAAVNLLWRGMKFIFMMMVAFWHSVLSPAVHFLYDHVFKPVFESIHGAATNLWRGLKFVFDMMKAYWKDVLGPAVHFLYDHVFKPVFESIRTMVHAVWYQGIRPIFVIFGNFFKDHVAPALNRGVTAIQKIWNLLASLAVKPINFVIDTIYNNGLAKLINGIPLVPDLPHINTVDPPKFAYGGDVTRGGRIPGGQNHKDVFHGMFMPKEFVLRSSVAQKIDRKHPGMLDRINAGSPRAGHLGRMGDMELLAGGEGPHFLNGGQTGGGAVNTIIPQALRWFSKLVGRPYVWGGAGPGGFDCSGAMGAMTNYLRGASNPYYRIGSTGTMPWSGFGAGPGNFSVGWSTSYGGSGIGHAAGTLAGVNVESSVDSPSGVKMGANARGAGDPGFQHMMHLLSLGANGASFGGGSGAVRGMSGLEQLRAIPGEIANLISEVGGMGDRFRDPWGTWIGDAMKQPLSKAKDYAWDKIKGVLGGIVGGARSIVGGFIPGGGGSSAAAAQQYALSLFPQHGWSTGPGPAGPNNMWQALAQLWQGESGWNYQATNPSSGAYGIPQALPASKMASAGSDWRTNYHTQVNWGMGYIADRYGNPYEAFRQWSLRDPHWYRGGGSTGVPDMALGGIVRRRAGGVMARLGEGRYDEAVTPLPMNWRNEKAGPKETHLHFEGDLVFPSIKNSNDAEAFIRHLENLAETA